MSAVEARVGQGLTGASTQIAAATLLAFGARVAIAVATFATAIDQTPRRLARKETSRPPA